MPDGKAILLSDYMGGDSAASGGAGHVVLDSFDALRSIGVDPHAIVGFGDVPSVASDRLVRLGGRDLRDAGASGVARAIYNPAARRSVEAALEGEDPDRTVVILHQWTRYLTPAAIGLLGRFRLMIYMHDYFWPCPNGSYYDFPRQRPCDRQPMGARCVAADCDQNGRVRKVGRLARHAALLAATRGTARNRLFLHISRHAHRTAAPLLSGENHAILHNPLRIGDRPSSPAEARHDFGYFGRLEPQKGVEMLVDAAETAGLSGLFVGQGSLASKIAARPRQTYRSWQSRDQMAAAMRSCRVVVLPSLWPETWGLVVPEAMAAGVPVLVSARAGSAELIERFGGGTTFDPAVPGDLRFKLEAAVGEHGREDRRAGSPYRSVAQWPEFRQFLSAERHARQIVALAADTWNIDLRASDRMAVTALG